jgi:hypothetical protein
METSVSFRIHKSPSLDLLPSKMKELNEHNHSPLIEQIFSGLLDFWTLSIVRYCKENSVSETRFVSVDWGGDGRHIFRCVRCT